MKLLITGGSGFIGTNLVDHLLGQKISLLNVDINPPKKEGHRKFWAKCDILNKEELMRQFGLYNPSLVIHLAARTDTDERNILDDYKTNTVGTANILEAIKNTQSVKRVVIVSSQYVNQYGFPQHDEDFAPETVYGQSKVITENLTRSAALQASWTIVRPTNIWGPWHPRYPNEFWYVLKRGWYFHPGKKPVARLYGYVGNVVYQIMQIMEAPIETVNHEIFYLGDMPLNLYDWANSFSLELTGANVRIVPRFVVRVLAWMGDILGMVNLKFPITTSRYKNMVTSNAAPMEKTIFQFGALPYSLDAGVKDTVRWLRETDERFL